MPPKNPTAAPLRRSSRLSSRAARTRPSPPPRLHFSDESSLTSLSDTTSEDESETNAGDVVEELAPPSGRDVSVAAAEGQPPGYGEEGPHVVDRPSSQELAYMGIYTLSDVICHRFIKVSTRMNDAYKCNRRRANRVI